MSLYILFTLKALTPLYNNSKNLQEKTMEMFKKLPRSKNRIKFFKIFIIY